jgi:hypothetical protein
MERKGPFTHRSGEAGLAGLPVKAVSLFVRLCFGGELGRRGLYRLQAYIRDYEGFIR